jgi:hypothetical protein
MFLAIHTEKDKNLKSYHRFLPAKVSLPSFLLFFFSTFSFAIVISLHSSYCILEFCCSWFSSFCFKGIA